MDEDSESEQPDSQLSFTSAYQQHASAVLAYLAAQGVEDAEAVTQDVFLALYPRLEGIRGGSGGIRTLLFSIAHARVVDYHRRKSRIPALLEYDPAEDPRISASAEDDVLAGHRGALALVANLSADHREVLALRIIADLSLEVTARIMEKTPGAVKQLQRRALAALKKELTAQVESAS